jgi:hypothetical protein
MIGLLNLLLNKSIILNKFIELDEGKIVSPIRFTYRIPFCSSSVKPKLGAKKRQVHPKR